jgi:ribonuclease P protein component
MLASENSLQGNKYFEKVKSEGKLYQFPDFGVCVLKRDDNQPSRFGFVVSTKISSLAVHRNRIKRAMVESTRRALTNAPVNYDMVFLTKKTMANKTTEEIMHQIANFLDSKVYLK